MHRNRSHSTSHRGLLSVLGLLCIGAIAGCDAGGGVPFVKPRVPVVVTTRDSLVGEGKVAIFSNQTQNRLTILVLFENKKLNERKEGNIDLDPNGKNEIGWLEGWVFVAGETITVSHPNYSSFSVTIP